MIQAITQKVIVSMQLAKMPLCMLIACSALLGFSLSPMGNLTLAVYVVLGIFFLSAGGACLNCCQESEQDALMSRTEKRPIPSGRLSVRAGLLIGLSFILVGIFVLFFGTGSELVVGLGVLSLLIYNAVYTPLKSRSILAIIPGAICGCLPPYIGWLAGGGGSSSYGALVLLVLFLLWQIPHFWLILLHHRNDYSEKNILSILDYVTKQQLEVIVLVWVLSMGVVMQLISAYFVALSLLTRFFVFGSGVLLSVCFVMNFLGYLSLSYKKLFVLLNSILLFSMLLVITDKILL